MFNKKRRLLTVIPVAVALAFWASVACAQGAIPSMGTGSCEIMIFSDYFCPPCKQTDMHAELLMRDLLATGKVKITFVDVQFNTLAPKYTKYYLSAVNANAEVGNVLNVRRTLFEAAQDKHIQTEDALSAYLKHKNIAIKPMDAYRVYPLINSAISGARITTTPTCIVRGFPFGEKRYDGEEEIINGLNELKKILLKRSQL
jgi:hypothetical protein